MKIHPQLRGWLIFAGIVLMFLALPLLKIRALMAMGKMAFIPLILGALVVLLALKGGRRKDQGRN